MAYSLAGDVEIEARRPPLRAIGKGDLNVELFARSWHPAPDPDGINVEVVSCALLRSTNVDPNPGQPLPPIFYFRPIVCCQIGEEKDFVIHGLPGYELLLGGVERRDQIGGFLFGDQATHSFFEVL